MLVAQTAELAVADVFAALRRSAESQLRVTETGIEIVVRFAPRPSLTAMASLIEAHC